ncbi:MAG: hypothetical protein KGL39_09355 [Patescibacteria group bacterium]|nr:hypothetical protein [Patescibacteria group bacterium]
METAQQALATPVTKPGLYKRLAAKCASHGSACLAVIIVLAALVIVLYVYYHGFLFLGPYAKGVTRLRASKKDKGGGAPADTDTGKDVQPDKETAKLIQSINDGAGEEGE